VIFNFCIFPAHEWRLKLEWVINQHLDRAAAEHESDQLQDDFEAVLGCPVSLAVQDARSSVLERKYHDYDQEHIADLHKQRETAHSDSSLPVRALLRQPSCQ
jgi:hypothetical protein